MKKFTYFITAIFATLILGMTVNAYAANSIKLTVSPSPARVGEEVKITVSVSGSAINATSLGIKINRNGGNLSVKEGSWSLSGPIKVFEISGTDADATKDCAAAKANCIGAMTFSKDNSIVKKQITGNVFTFTVKGPSTNKVLSSDKLTVTLSYSNSLAGTEVKGKVYASATFTPNFYTVAKDTTASSSTYGKICYYLNGKVATSYNSFATASNGTRYIFKNGTVNTAITRAQADNGVVKYYKQGVLQPSYTGFAKAYSGTIYYFKNGSVCTSYTKAAGYGGVVYYFKAGVSQKSYTGFGKAQSGTVYRFKSGKVDTTYTCAAGYNGIVYYFAKGILQTSYTGFGKAQSGTIYRFKNGSVDTGFTKVAGYGGVVYYFKAGKSVNNYTGTGVAASGTKYKFVNGKATKIS